MGFWLNAVAIVSVAVAILSYPYLGGGPPRTLEPANPDGQPSLGDGVTRKVLVIGGGIAGLTAALELAERGFDVTVKEQGDSLGGKFATMPFEVMGEKFDLSTILHVSFHNYHNFKRIRQRLDLDKFYVPWKDNHMAFKDYEWENMYSTGPWPLNLVGVIMRSPNLSIMTAMRNWRVSLDFVLYDHDTVYEEYDDLTYAEWAGRLGVVDAFGDIWLKPAISASFNNISTFSAAELLVTSHVLFLSVAEAESRERSTENSGVVLVNPWTNKLKELGVKFELGSPLTSLGVDPSSGKVTHDVSKPSNIYDHVILAVDLVSAKKIISQSASDPKNSNSSFGKLEAALNHLPVAKPVKILKIWFDKRVRNDQKYQMLQTPQHRPVTMVTQLHWIEKQHRQWANKTGGSVMEISLYSWEYGEKTAEEIWELVKPALHEIFPDMVEENFKVLATHLVTINNLASFEIGTAKYRPRPTYPADIGIPNLSLAGDWLRTDYPSVLLERSVSTAMEAANQVLLSEGVRQVPLVVTTSNGPGFI